MIKGFWFLSILVVSQSGAVFGMVQDDEDDSIPVEPTPVSDEVTKTHFYARDGKHNHTHLYPQSTINQTNHNKTFIEMPPEERLPYEERILKAVTKGSIAGVETYVGQKVLKGALELDKRVFGPETQELYKESKTNLSQTVEGMKLGRDLITGLKEQINFCSNEEKKKAYLKRLLEMKEQLVFSAEFYSQTHAITVERLVRMEKLLHVNVSVATQIKNELRLNKDDEEKKLLMSLFERNLDRLFEDAYSIVFPETHKPDHQSGLAHDTPASSEIRSLTQREKTFAAGSIVFGIGVIALLVGSRPGA